MPVAVTTAPGSALQLGERTCEQIARRIPERGVIVRALLTEAAKRERCRQVNGWHDGAGGSVALETGAHGASTGSGL